MSKKTIHCGRRLSNAKDGEQGLELPLQAVPRPVERQEGVDVAGGGGGQHAVHPAQRILPEIQRVLVAGKQPGSGVGGLCVKCYRVGGGSLTPPKHPPQETNTPQGGAYANIWFKATRAIGKGHAIRGSWLSSDCK